METIPELLNLAVDHHRTGRFVDAEMLCRQALQTQPEHVEALHLLGIIAHQTGRHRDAAELIGRAVELHPETVRYRSNLGHVRLALGQVEEAEALFRTALALKPDFAEAHNNLGNALRRQGRMADAEIAYRAALRCRAAYPDAHYNLGNTLRDLGRPDDALLHYREALRLRPQLAEAQQALDVLLAGREDAEPDARPVEREVGVDEAIRLAVGMFENGQHVECESLCRKILATGARAAEALTLLGGALRVLGRTEEAEARLREAVAFEPKFPGPYSALAGILYNDGRVNEALSLAEEAAHRDPSFAEAHNTLGAAHLALGELERAESCFREAVRLDGDYSRAHRNLGLTLLQAGKFREGWEENEWRWRCQDFPDRPRNFTQRQWRGEPLDDATLLIYPEQGFGDFIQFCRYLPLAASRVRTVVEVRPPLARLLPRLPSTAQIVVQGAALPEFDVQCSIMSLPLVFGTTLETVPADSPYLSADPAAVRKWQERLLELPGLKVGLVWMGGPSYRVDRRRSMALERLAPLAAVPGLSFVSLQKGDAAAEAKAPPSGMTLHDWTDELKDFADTAALIAALDLVISVDTAVAHLAGALGKPIWLLNRFDTCWRWMRDRSDSPWYPTMRIFRQPAPGDWQNVVAAVSRELAARWS